MRIAERTRVKNEKVERKAERENKKELKEKLKSHADYLNELQKVFNTFIRKRDEGKDCISCGRNMVGRKGDASHYYSVGSTSALRFNEDNTHLSCVPCNQWLSGNLIEYGKRLPSRIGQERFDALHEMKHMEFKLSIPEIKELIVEYKNKILNPKVK